MRLWMVAGRTLVRCVLAGVEIAAVETAPYDWFLLVKDLVAFDIGQEFQVALLVLLFGDCYGDKYVGDLREALLTGNGGKARVHLRMLVMLASGGLPQVFRSRAYDA